jgi:hypothetical protein
MCDDDDFPDHSAWDQAFDEGRVQMGRYILSIQGQQLFGKPCPKIKAALAAIDDPDRLQRMIDSLLDVKSWKALLAVK